MKRALVAIAVAGALAFGANEAQAQLAFGPQVSWGSDSDFGVGARVQLGLGTLYPGLFGIGSFDYFFDPSGDDACEVVDLDCDITYWELNANVALPLPLAPNMATYFGAGLNYANISVDVEGFGSDSESEIGLNLLGGIRFAAPLSPFVEGRFELGGGEQFVLTGGILLGGP